MYVRNDQQPNHIPRSCMQTPAIALHCIALNCTREIDISRPATGVQIDGSLDRRVTHAWMAERTNGRAGGQSAGVRNNLIKPEDVQSGLAITDAKRVGSVLSGIAMANRVGAGGVVGVGLCLFLFFDLTSS